MRKGSLQLGINAIVILVLAIVLLGLGIGLIRNWFADFEDVGQISEQVRNQIVEDLQSGDKKMSIPTRSLELTKRDSKTIGIGVKNVGDGVMTYAMDIDIVQGESIKMNPTDDATREDITYDTSLKKLDATDPSIEPVKLASKTDTGDSIIKATIYQWHKPTSGAADPNTNQMLQYLLGQPNGAPTSQLWCRNLHPNAAVARCWEEYASETFFVTVR